MKHKKKSIIYLVIGLILIMFNLGSQLFHYQDCLKANLYACNFLGTTDIFYFLGYNIYSIIGIILIVIFNVSIFKHNYSNSIKNTVNKNYQKKYFTRKKVLYIFISFIIILLGTLGIYLIIINNNLKNEMKNLKNNLENLEFEYDSEMEQNKELKEKAEYFDKNIVFIVEGYNNYYINYSCLKYLENPKGNVMLKKNAEDQGLKEYDCYNEIYESIIKDINERTYTPSENRN